MARRAAVVGVGQMKYVTKRPEVSTPELVREAAQNALADAGLSAKDLDAVIFASAPEAFEGVNAPDKWCSTAAGALGKPFMRIATGGETGTSGALAGFYHVVSGVFDIVMVVALQRVAESPDAQFILSTIYDPIYEKGFGLNIITSVAFQASRQIYRYGLTEEQMAKVSVKNHFNALKNPYAHLRFKITVDDVLKSRVICWPIKLYDVCPRSDGACAIIIASEEKAKKISNTPAWINGIASVGDAYSWGDRLGDVKYDIADTRAQYVAAQRAYKMAGITNPRKEIDVAEVYAPFSNTEISAYEAMGFCAKGEGGKFIEDGISEMTGELPVCPSGGCMTANPIGATGLVRVAEAALQVMGKAGEHQVPNVKTALAAGCGGANQFYAVVILSKKPT